MDEVRADHFVLLGREWEAQGRQRVFMSARESSEPRPSCSPPCLRRKEESDKGGETRCAPPTGRLPSHPMMPRYSSESDAAFMTALIAS